MAENNYKVTQVKR